MPPSDPVGAWKSIDRNSSWRVALPIEPQLESDRAFKVGRRKKFNSLYWVSTTIKFHPNNVSLLCGFLLALDVKLASVGVCEGSLELEQI